MKMRLKTSSYRIIVLFLMLIASTIYLFGCAPDSQQNTGNIETVEAPKQDLQLDTDAPGQIRLPLPEDPENPPDSAAMAQTDAVQFPIDGEKFNTPEMAMEHSHRIDEAKTAFLSLLDTERPLLEWTSQQMLQLQQAAVSENPQLFSDPQQRAAWKCPYYREGVLAWELTADEGRLAHLKEIEDALNSLSASGAFDQAYPVLDSPILEGDICQFKLELVDSLGYHFCAVSLNYCPQERPKSHPYYTLEWQDSHWALYVEWHE